MSIRWLFLLILALLLFVFVAVNSVAFTTPTTLSLVVGTVHAPLGMVMLGILAVATVIFLGYAFYMHSRNVIESRRLTRALDRARELASKAEESRIAELRAWLETRLNELTALPGAHATVAAGSDDLRRLIEQGFNGIAAQIAELDDRLTRHAVTSAP